MRTRHRCQGLAMLALAALLAVPLLPAAAGDDPATAWRRYDERGRYAGTAYRRSPDLIRFYDEKGRFAGTAQRRADGAWRRYDQSGRFSGSLRERSR